MRAKRVLDHALVFVAWIPPRIGANNSFRFRHGYIQTLVRIPQCLDLGAQINRVSQVLR
jgi:hypothetical protein